MEPRCQRFERHVAIKMLAPELAGEPELERALIAAGARKDRYSYMAPEQLAGEPITGAADQFDARRMIAEAQRGRAPATAIDLGDWVRARIGIFPMMENGRSLAPTGFSVDRAWVASHIVT